METTMKIEYRRQGESSIGAWQPLTNLDELIWDGVYALRMSGDDNTSGLPFRVDDNDSMTFVVKDHAHDGRLQNNRTIVQTITRVEHSTGKVFVYNRTRQYNNGSNSWSDWKLACDENGHPTFENNTVLQVEKNKDAIDNEITRAKSIEEELDARVTTNATDLAFEIARAQSVEQNIKSGMRSTTPRVHIGGLQNNGDPRPEVNSRAYSAPVTGNGEIVVSDEYYIDAIKMFSKDGTALGYDNYDAQSYAFDDGVDYQFSFRRKDGSPFTTDELKRVVQSFIIDTIVWGAGKDLNNYRCAGEYSIEGKRENTADNMPIYNIGNINARLTVLNAGGCVTQVLTLLNIGGGDSNIYTRTMQNGTWNMWNKLQSNVEVGAIGLGQTRTFDHLTDNGIYSGVNVYATATDDNGYPITAFETFVLITINAYLTGGGVSQLKYSLLPDGTTCVAKRSKQENTWSDWRDLESDISTMNKLQTTVDSLVNENTRAKEVQESVKRTAVDISSLVCTASNENVTITGKSMDGEVAHSAEIPVATTEKAGLMSAEDKGGLEKLITIDYADNSYTAGKWVEENGRIVAASSSSYAKYSPIPVCVGQKIVYSADPGSNKTLYITDKDGFVIYTASHNNGEIYAPDKAAFVYITSTNGRYSCVVYGVYDTYSYRAQKLGKLIGEDIAFPLNGYYTATGAWQASNSWYCTDKIAVSENSGVETNATYIACWDINGEWLGRNAGKDGILEGTKYIAIYGQNDGYYLRFNSDYCNIPTHEDIHILTRSVASLVEERTSVDVEMLNNVELVGNNVAVVEGVAGEVGAKYSVPITVKGGYGITMTFKMPDDLHTAVYERELISFGTRASATTNGFSVDIKSVLPTNDLSQISCKSTLGFYPTNSKTNNYAGSLSVGSTNRPFVGEAAFSIRYTGSLEGNADIAYTLGEDALRVYHTDTDADVLNIPYPEDGLITSLLDAINAHTSTLEAVGYAAENLTLDNIIKCSAIPLIGTYEGTTDAFPSFVLLKDDYWHTLEVRFDASKGKGLDMIAGYIDGHRFYHIDKGYKLYGDGYFKSELTFGCDGVVVKSIKVAPTLKSEIPNIVALCQHSINGDEKFNSTVTSSTNLSVTYGRTEELLRVFKKYGFKYVTSEQINGYLRRGEVLPHNSFTIIHDDYHYMRENAEKEYARDIRKLYLRNGIKASFGLIPAYLTDEEIAEVEKDKDVFEFLIHDDYSLSSSKGYQAIADRIANNISNFKSKLYTSNIWVYTGGVFDANTKMMLQASGISIAYYTSGTTTSGGICDASDRLGLPRLYCNDTGTTISELEEILSNLVNH